MALFTLNVTEDLPMTGQGVDQQLLSIDSWGSIDTYVESPTDILANTAEVDLNETLSSAIVINYTDDMNIADSFSVVSIHNPNTQKELSDAFSASSIYSTPFIDKSIAESLGIVSPWTPIFSLNIIESIIVRSKLSKIIGLVVDVELALGEITDVGDGIFGHEHFRTREALTVSLIKNISESVLNISEEFNRAQLIKNFAELLVITDVDGNTVLKQFDEIVGVIDTYTRSLNAKVSSMYLLREGFSSEEEFEELAMFGGPAGFEHYKTYLQGDYEFQEARIRAIVESDGNPTSRVEISEINVEVDIPDTTDSSLDLGPVVITAAESDGGGKVVLFNRFFNISPEIVITLKDTTTALKLPVIVSKTTTQFTVKVLDNAGDGIDATISWIAQGY